MRATDIIKKKRDGGELTSEEINFFVRGVVDGSVPDYQTSALLMAIYIRGMTEAETLALTYALRDSGEKVDLSDLVQGVTADKHSSGGVGDKTTLVVAPIVASCGVKVAKMSGRGLGHTGGTVDKLESIPGFCSQMDAIGFARIVNEVGVCVVGQSKNLTPADRKMYALRDVTATVDKLPLIVSSIMSKKLAAGSDVIVLDVKTGSGAFMKTREEARQLAEQMVAIGRLAGKKTMAVVSNMDMPLGNAIGNALEVIEAAETLKGKGPQDLVTLSLTLASCMLYLAGKGSRSDCYAMAQQALQSGRAYQTLRAMIQAQGGDVGYLDDPARFGQALHRRTVAALQDGYIAQVDAERYGVASQLLGAGRAKVGDVVDPLAGVVLVRKPGDYVRCGEPIAVLHTNRAETLDEAERTLRGATLWSATPVDVPNVVLDIVE